MKKVILNREEIFNGDLILVNLSRPIQNNYYRKSLLTTYGISLQRNVAITLEKLLKKTNRFENIIPISGYRSKIEQEKLYENSLKDNGIEFTRKYVALPDHSEHQTGLCVDLAIDKPNIDFITPEFPYNYECNLFRKKGIEGGFIERYSLGKETLTNISHEPWHFRYVGFPHSSIIHEKNFCLEEYIEWIKEFKHCENHLEFVSESEIIEISYIKANEDSDTEIMIREDVREHIISGNNVDGFIITTWRNIDE